MSDRPTWARTWLDVAEVVSRRSLCVNSRVGAVVVTVDERLNSTGYNGPPRGFRAPSGYSAGGPCSNWCPRAMKGEGSGSQDYSACASIHAEVNALLRADASAIHLGTMYVTRAPCINCAKVIANSGLQRLSCEPGAEDDEERALETFRYLHKCGLMAGYHGGGGKGAYLT